MNPEITFTTYVVFTPCGACPFRDPKKPCGPPVAILSGTPTCQKHLDRIRRMEQLELEKAR